MSRRFQARNEEHEMPSRAAELGDRHTAGELSVKALPPGVCEIQVFGSCHERAPGLEKGDQPSSIAAVARLDLPYAYVENAVFEVVWFGDILHVV